MKTAIFVVMAAAALMMQSAAGGFPAAIDGTTGATEEVETEVKTEPEKKKDDKKKKKDAERRDREVRDSLAFEVAVAAVSDGHFVIMADRIRGKYGRTVNVNNTTNFVLVQGDKATVQFALEGGMSGPNGLGGITVEGTVSGVKTEFNKKGDLVYSMYVTGTAISADVSLTLPRGSSFCEVTVNSNYSSNRLVFSGELKPYNAPVFKGREIP